MEKKRQLKEKTVSGEKEQERQDMIVCYNHGIVMRDGVTLRGNLYRPGREGAYPAILMRTIFRKKTLSRSWGFYDPEYYVQHGYAVYIQDVRGIGESEGEFVRFSADREDAYDTVEGIAAQSWCDGNVGMFGNYYAAFLEFQAAVAKPPHLKAICPFETHVSLNRNNDSWGINFYYAHIGWCLAREVSRMLEGHYSKEITDRYLQQMRDYLEHYIQIVAELPPGKFPMREVRDIFTLVGEYFDVALSCYDDPEAIKREGRLMELEEMEVPALLLANWRETTRNTMIGHGDRMRRNAKGNARLSEVVIGYWEPGMPMSCAENALYIPENHFSVEQEILRWFDRWLKGKDTEEKKPYRLYDPGAGSFVELEEWKDEGESTQIWYLDSDGHANTAHGNGKLISVQPEKECGSAAGSDICLYDPQNPIPGREYGGDCTQLEEREDMLVYTSGKLEEDVCVCGVPKVALYASSTAPDTDFIVYLADVDEGGKTILAGDGIVRARYRDSRTARLMEPGTIYRFEIKLSNLVYTFRKGHRIRLEVRNSDYPKFDRNRNTGRRPETDDGFCIARNTVYHNAEAGSMLVLPLR